MLLRFDKPSPPELMAAAQRIALEHDPELAWEFAPDQEFGFADPARNYFGAKAGVRSRPQR